MIISSAIRIDCIFTASTLTPYPFVLITRAGLPTATELGGMLFVTTLPAPTTLFSPIVIPGRTIAFAPIQT
jgi:hypothetical protein